MIDPRHLRVLRAVARHGSYSAAARELGYTQPAISQQIRSLEREVGEVLTARAGRQMRLTEAGQALARHAPGILASLAAAQDEVAAIAGLRAGRVRVVSFPSASAALVPAAVASVAGRHPNLRVTLAEAEPPESIASLRAGEADVVLTFRYLDQDQTAVEVGRPGGHHEPHAGAAEPVEADLSRTPLLVDRVSAVLPEGHRLSGRTWLSLAELADERWIAGCPRCRGHLIRACARAGFTPNIAFATDDYVAAQGLIAAGLGVGMAPNLALASHRRPDVTVAPLRPHPTREIDAVTFPDLARTPAVRVMLAALTDAARPR